MLFGEKNKSAQLLKIWGAVLLAVAFSGCAKQTFDNQKFSQTVSANQYLTIKPKVDIIMFQDESASMVQPMTTLKGQLNSFIQSINGNWDFRFAVLPLLRNDDLRNRWIVAQNCSGINYCLTPSQVPSYFDNGSGWYTANSSIGSVDLGFQYMQSNLANTASMVNSGFLRSDAMLVVIPFTNGNDTTGMSFPNDYKDRGDGQQVPDYASAAATNSYNAFYNFLAGYKSSLSQLSFFSVAAGANNANPDYSYSCYGGTAWAGTRYHNIALQIDQAYAGVTNGGQFDICSGQLSSVLSTIATRMRDTVLAIEFNYVVLADRPNPAKLTILKNGQPIPANNSVNGWTLYNVVSGTHQYTNNKATSYAPYSGNNQSGYFIELHGTARFKGSDQISVQYEKL